jgi:hypothetical protein
MLWEKKRFEGSLSKNIQKKCLKKCRFDVIINDVLYISFLEVSWVSLRRRKNNKVFLSF